MNHRTLALQLQYAGFGTAHDEEDGAIAPDPLLVAQVRDRIGYFLDSVDRCEILVAPGATAEGRIVLLVAPATEEHLPLILSAIAQERALLAELGIDPHEVRRQRDHIRIDVPLPVETGVR